MPRPRKRRPKHRPHLGGIIHTYQAYDPKSFPNPMTPPPDMVSGAFEHMMMFGSMRQFTDQELADAIHIDPQQIQGFGPSLDSLIAMLEERKRRILETYETDSVQNAAGDAFHGAAAQLDPPPKLEKRFRREVRDEQLRALEQLWYSAERSHPQFAAQLLHLIGHLAEKYLIDALASGYDFTGRQSMDIPKALDIKQELETIDELLEQLRDALENAQLAVIDMEALSEFAEPGDMDQLRSLQQQVEDYIREMASQQGLEFTRDGYQLSPKAFRIFQGKLLAKIFEDIQASRSGRHTGNITGDGAVEMSRTRPYEFGDSPAQMDIPQTILNAMLREGAQPQSKQRVRFKSEDIEVHMTRNTPKCATVVILDMSGSMRHGELYINAKRMGLALDGLIRSEYPGDYLRFVEMATFSRQVPIADLPKLMPKPVTIYDPVVRLKADMSDEHLSELHVPPHFTNIQHALRLARQLLAGSDTANRQIILITDGLPTAHFEDEHLYLLYPPHPRTEQATMREAHQCQRENITMNVFLLPNWGQSEEDVQFAHRMTEATRGRVFFTGGRDLDRFVVWDYLNNRRHIMG